MSTNICKNERLSSLVDDEASSFERRRLIDELESDAEMRERFARYRLIGEAMRGRPVAVEPDFARSVMARIEQEDEVGASPWIRHARPLKAAGGVGMAAAVAVAVLVGVQNFTGQPGSGSPAQAPLASNPVSPSSSSGELRLVGNSGAGSQQLQWLNPDNPWASSVQQSPVAINAVDRQGIDMNDARINVYLMNHAESTMGRGFVPVTAGFVSGAAGD